MGNAWQRLMTRLHHHKDVRILMCGLDAAGKTTALYKLKLGEVVTTIPTIGFNVETIEYKGVNFVAWDVSGRDKIRPLWRHYYQNTQVLIFVIDSNDRERMEECKDELWRFLGEDELKSTTLLVMANKQDLPGALSVEEVKGKLGLDKIRDRSWHIQGTSATTGDGLYEGLNWLQSTLAQKETKEAVLKPLKEVAPAAPEGKPANGSWWSMLSKYFIRTT